MLDFDVFLCHNRQDKSVVKEIGEKLKERGLRPWELRPGLPWQRALEEQIKNIKAAAVFVGDSGMGPWQDLELEAYLRQFVQDGRPVIPVILGSCKDTPELPLFLRGMTWVDFRIIAPDPMERLVWGITGQRFNNRTEHIEDTVSKTETAEAKDRRTKAMLVKYLAKYKRKRSYQYIRQNLGEEFTDEQLDHLISNYPNELRNQGIKGKSKGVALVEPRTKEEVSLPSEDAGNDVISNSIGMPLEPKRKPTNGYDQIKREQEITKAQEIDNKTKCVRFIREFCEWFAKELGVECGRDIRRGAPGESIHKIEQSHKPVSFVDPPTPRRDNEGWVWTEVTVGSRKFDIDVWYGGGSYRIKTLGREFEDAEREDAFTHIKDMLTKPPRSVIPASTSEDTDESVELNRYATQPGSAELNDPDKVKDVVLLIHGIRDHATWQSMVSRELGHPSARVIGIKYGYFNVFLFFLPRWPFDFTKRPREKVLRQLRQAKDEYKDVSVVAHSFGSYLITRILSEETDIRLKRILLCGSVVEQDFRWDKVKQRIGDSSESETRLSIVNDCGTKDIFPILARTFSWRYGDAGSNGFGQTLVTDRCHKGGHSLFSNNPDFVRTYWKPFFHDGYIADGDGTFREGIPWYIRFLPGLIWMTLLLIATIVAMGFGTRTTTEPPPPLEGFVWIKPGTFTMGSPEGESDRQDDENEVTLTEGFYLGKYEVTQEEYEKVMGVANPSHFKKPRSPVETVSWHDAIKYCNLRSVQERLSPYYRVTDGKEVTIPDRDGDGYRLPTEAEWEYACRAGSEASYCFDGDEEQLDEYAWFDKNSGGTTHPVGEKKPNGWGLYDMHGNVWEWCWDWYNEYPTTPQDNPNGRRVIRGGGWSGGAVLCRSATRGRIVPVLRSLYLGFRVARNSVRRDQP